MSQFVSVIILNHNGEKFLDTCLRSVLQSNYPNFEVIVVDNASTDNSLDLISDIYKNCPVIKIVKNEENLGFPGGNNVGVQKASGKYVVFLNNDTEVEPMWLDEIVKVMESDPQVAVCQSKLLSLDNKQIFDSTGDFIDFYGVTMCRSQGIVDNGQYNRIEEIFSARGASMMVRRSALEEVGLFDPDFFLQFEDIDLCWRMRLRGYKVVYVPTSVVYHKGLGTPSDMRLYHGQKNMLLLMIKNYSISNLVSCLPVYLVVAFGGIIRAVFIRKQNTSLLTKMRAFGWVLLNIRDIIIRRSSVQYRIRKVSDDVIKKSMLQTNLGLYTRYAIEMGRISNNPVEKKKLAEWYYLMTQPKHA